MWFRNLTVTIKLLEMDNVNSYKEKNSCLISFTCISYIGQDCV